MSRIKELPEFASLCSFIQLFGEELNVTLSHNQLATFLEVKDAENVPKLWIDIHRKLLSRIKYNCSITKWEGTLKKCLFNVLGYDSELANLNGTNYFEITPDNRAKILNILFDCQFDKNIKFKEKVNLKFISDLRTQPFGSDIHGCIYWLFVDSDVSIIMYKENLEEESFKIVAENLVDLHKLQDELTEMDCENAILSKLYLDTSPSDEIDNSRTQSPFIDNCNEKSTIRVDSVKMESLEIAKIEETDQHSEHELKIEEFPDPNINESQTMVNTDEPVKTEEQELNFNKSKSENLEIIDIFPEDNAENLEKSTMEVIKPESPTPNCEDQFSSTGLRRSERKRKPVSLFSIGYPETCKKYKSSSNQKTEKEIIKKPKDSKKEHKKEKIKRKKGRPRKNPELNEEKVSKDKKKPKKPKSKHKKGRGHKKHKKSKHPWDTAESSDEHIDYEDDDETYLNEESEPSVSVNEIWDDKPESDFDVDKISCSSDEETSKARGRNYFRQKSIKKEKQEIDDKPCQICLRNNIPEMILLCDECDLGHHAMCLRPSLMIIPEGDWYCPKCQHRKLLNKLIEKIVELEKSMLKNNAKIRMQERLNFVNISMTNILSRNQERKQARKQHSCESDESQSDCNSSSQSLSTSSGSYDDSSDDNDNNNNNSSEIDSTKPSTQGRYRFRETSRKDSTKYNFEEIDKIFDDALEHDEKYKLLKKEHQEERIRESENSETQVESEPEYDYSGIEPRKKSSGKDMANIVSEDSRPPRSVVKKKRQKYDSDYDDFEDDTKDIDFKISDQSDSEFDEYECIEGDLTNCSDDDWITTKNKRSTRKTVASCKKEKKRRYIPDISSTASRPKRNATRNVNYRNMLCDEEDDDDERDSALNERSPEYESSEDNAVKPPPVVSRKKDKHKLLGGRAKRRLISDSEYEEEQEEDEDDEEEDDDDVEDEEPNYDDDDDENGSGSTEKLEAGVKRNSKLGLHSDSDIETELLPSTTTTTKLPRIDNDDDEELSAQLLRTPLLPVPIPSGVAIATVVNTGVISSLGTSIAPLPSLATMLNPMRAKADEDNDQVENEVESETEECNLTISLSDSSTNHNGAASLT